MATIKTRTTKKNENSPAHTRRTRVHGTHRRCKERVQRLVPRPEEFQGQVAGAGGRHGVRDRVACQAAAASARLVDDEPVEVHLQAVAGPDGADLRRDAQQVQPAQSGTRRLVLLAQRPRGGGHLAEAGAFGATAATAAAAACCCSSEL